MILSDTLSAHLPGRPTAVALGFFDGIHRGHTKVISAAVQAARQQGLIPCVFTFSPPGKGGPKPVGELIQTDEVKQYILERMGVRQIFRPPFEEFREHFLSVVKICAVNGCLLGNDIQLLNTLGSQ